MLQPLNRLQFYAEFIEKETGIVFSDRNYFQLQNRLDEIVRSLGMTGMDELWERCKSGIHGPVRQLLLDVATNNETSFFRDGKVFKSFEMELLPALLKQRAASGLKIWSAACSFGQEPYSIAMILEAAQKKQKFSYQIKATDFADRAVARASEGRYSQLEVQRGLGATQLVRYFRKDENNDWHVKPEIKAKVKVSKLNLLGNLSIGDKFDVIFCRNVLIYQRQEKKQAILGQLALRLQPWGRLVLGAGETLIGMDLPLKAYEYGAALFYGAPDSGDSLAEGSKAA